MNRYKVILLTIISIGIGIFIGIKIDFKNESLTGYKEKHSGQRRLTNKLLDYDIPPTNELGNYKTELQNYIKEALASKKALNIAVYYRDLNNGPWVGVNESEKFIPASLLKLPLMMVYFKKAETDPSILNKKYTFKNAQFDIVSVQHYEHLNPLKEGSEYTVNELIRRMIVNSDNESLYILTSNVDNDLQMDLYSKLGFPIPKNITLDEEFISPRNIGSFFRVLYNATYLNEAMSEKALQLLTESDFSSGLTAGVPKSVVVAQKYGERNVNNEIELHDCGIVYFPNHPYTLCVMTEGTNYEDLSSIIMNISKLTYEQVEKFN